MIFQKLIKSRWLVLSLLAGLITAVALVSSIPMYTDGILKRMLTKELESFQERTGKYPGSYFIKKSYRFFSSGEFNLAAYPGDSKVITEKLAPQFTLPIVEHNHGMKITMLRLLPHIQREDEPKHQYVELGAKTDFHTRITLVHGRLFSREKREGVFEAVVTERAMRDLDLRLNEVYVVAAPEKMIKEPFLVRVVGVFTIMEGQDLYWFGGLARSNKSFFIDYDLFQHEFLSMPSLPDTEVEWYYALDYHDLNSTNYKKVLSIFKDHRWVYIKRRISFDIPIIPILEEYIHKERRLNLTLAFLQVPVLLMLAFFLYMVSLLIIEREKNEIAVLKSRGAGKLQVFLIYLWGNLFVSLIALILGPPFGLLLCRMLGSTNGFLEFIKRTALPITLSWKAYAFSLICIALFMLSILIPAFLSSRTTIVLYKQKIAHRKNSPVWKKYLIDFVLIGISLYGLYRYHLQQKTLAITGVEGSELPIDPLLFIISVVFIFGCGMLFIRFYPYLVRFIFWLGRRFWPPTLYASFTNVGRSAGYEHFIIIFLILTVALGVFNSSAARTVNKNVEDKIYYSIGADITAKPYRTGNPAFQRTFISDMIPQDHYAENGETEEFIGSKFQSQIFDPWREKDQLFDAFARLKGVKAATVVFRRDDVRVKTDQRDYLTATLLGITPHEFAEVAWFRSDLLPYHWHNYLNLMSHNPNAVLVSRSFSERYNLHAGDPISFYWNDQKAIDGIVYSFVDFWPTFNPYEEKTVRGGVNLIVANLTYLRSKRASGIQEIWIKKDEKGTSSEIYEEIEANKLDVEELKDATQEIIVQKNNPVLMGTNGLLTLGFVVTLGVSFIGFLICWILSIQSRVLQFGIIRAIGLAGRKVIWIIVWEQLLISGPAVLVGILVGGAAAQAFVPMLQIVSSTTQQVPPFVVGALWKDYINLFVFVTIMFVGVLAILSILISRIKIHQAIKLGEE